MKIKQQHIILVIVATMIILPIAYFFLKHKYIAPSRPAALRSESLADYDFSGDYSKPT
jgi:hypothetical protein